MAFNNYFNRIIHLGNDYLSSFALFCVFLLCGILNTYRYILRSIIETLVKIMPYIYHFFSEPTTLKVK